MINRRLQEARRPWAWLIFDVRQRMKIRWRILIIASIATLVHFASLAVFEDMPAEPRWYHYPLLLPLVAAVTIAGDAHNPNAIVGILTWAIMCLVAGITGERVLWMFVRRRPSSN